MLFISEGWGVGQGAREAGKETDWRLYKESRMKAMLDFLFLHHPRPPPGRGGAAALQIRPQSIDRDAVQIRPQSIGTRSGDSRPN